MKLLKNKNENVLVQLKEQVNNMNLDAPNEMCELIDNKLNILINNISYEKYLCFIKSNKKLKLYDDMMGKYANNFPLSKEMINMLNDDFYQDILNILDKKIKELNL